MQTPNVKPSQMQTTSSNSKTAFCRECGKAVVPYQSPLTGRMWERELCDDCLNADYLARERQRIEATTIAAARRHEERWAALCPLLYRNTDPAKLPPEPLAKVLAWQYGSRGLLLHGETDRCKTRAAWLLLRRLHDERRDIIAFDCVGFGHECAKRFRDSDGDGERWAKNLAEVPVLFLDDFGKGKFTERVEVELFGLVERRTANCLPIILTTNFVGEALEAKMSPDRGAPLVRRLREFCEDVCF